MKKTKISSYKEGSKALKKQLSELISPNAFGVFNSDAEELNKEHTFILKRKVGDKAPNFRLLNTGNEPVNLYDVLKTKKVVLTFYKGTWCPYCNLMLSHYETALPEIQKAGATILAISPQTPEESLNIKEKNNVQFEILSDNGNIVSKEFTTIHKIPEKSLTKMTELGTDYDSYYSDEASELPIPATFIIEKDGTISFAKTEGGDYRNRVESSEIINALHKNKS
ncbi:redoxin domain-containing protein [uncultured Croceitalea sp.]|uniref:peroxiredoxin family protein n=1 Tax=uncultured Croceitalea sp. TaxID=1798908 RepID=UPI0033056A15